MSPDKTNLEHAENNYWSWTNNYSYEDEDNEEYLEMILDWDNFDLEQQ